MKRVKTMLFVAALTLCAMGAAQALYPVFCSGPPEYRCEVTPIGPDGRPIGPTEVTYGDTLYVF